MHPLSSCIAATGPYLRPEQVLPVLEEAINRFLRQLLDVHVVPVCKQADYLSRAASVAGAADDAHASLQL